MKIFELSHEDLHHIDIMFEGRDGLIIGYVCDLVTTIKGNNILFLIGTVNTETYKEDEYKIKIEFKYKQDVIYTDLKNARTMAFCNVTKRGFGNVIE